MWVERRCPDSEGFRVHGLTHCSDKKTKPAHINETRPRQLSSASLIGDDEAHAADPDKKIQNIAKFSGEQRNRFEEDSHGRNKNHGRWRQEQILPDENKRLEW